MSKEEYEREYGRTKLDHVLSHMTKAFGKFLEFLAILFLPFGIVEQVCIYGTTHSNQIISLLLVLLILFTALGVRAVNKLRK
ncbi:hypothetical protein [Lactobacillus crispatus]|uniref:Uncharacterized protein n=1 Tax=Lactobacillus crispatus TaxID=47770 RepID=A0A4Q0LW69_9LACO|nr:hypothetical protein [Lactobacillus crispatus]CPR80945.1 Uncharacterised protein [Chlamydia trachomatis]MCT7799529.1 hypothetical protein [Lactobacillus crispatus]MCT7853021.1 hypothetical protein [Lactobacillus crispatus]MCZ3785233.1 hypothetical protein [Lactobacillus crispatus]MCZ3792850.1 hypothetical protein [Lactobacillus crispatus]